jgi:hypothetical protein
MVNFIRARLSAATNQIEGITVFLPLGQTKGGRSNQLLTGNRSNKTPHEIDSD